MQAFLILYLVYYGHRNKTLVNEELRHVTFNTGAALLEALVLSAVNHSDTYGYKITQDVRSVVDVSDSTLYPVLRRLEKDGFLAAYDKEYAGRNRRYYTITPQGQERLMESRTEWAAYKENIEKVDCKMKLDT